jgi:hypothetical protein
VVRVTVGRFWHLSFTIIFLRQVAARKAAEKAADDELAFQEELLEMEERAAALETALPELREALEEKARECEKCA